MADAPEAGNGSEIHNDAITWYEGQMAGRRISMIRDRFSISSRTIRRLRLGWLGDKRSQGQGEGLFLPVQDADGKTRAARFIPEDKASHWASSELPQLETISLDPRPLGLRDLVERKHVTIILTFTEADYLATEELMLGKPIGVIGIMDRHFPENWCEKIVNGRKVVAVIPGDVAFDEFERCILRPMLDKQKEDGKLKSLAYLRFRKDGGGGSIVDWKLQGGDFDKFRELIIESSRGQEEQRIQEPASKNPPSEAKEAPAKELTSFAQIDDPNFTDKRVTVPICILGETSNVYDSPFRFKADSCPEIAKFNEQTGEGCIQCRDRVYTIDAGSPEHIAAYKSSDSVRSRICREFIRCPLNRKPRIDILEKATFREMIACQYSERLVDREGKDGHETNIDGRDERLTERPIYIGIRAGQPTFVDPRGYKATGWVRTNPRDATRTFLVESMEPIKEPFETFDYKDHLETLSKLKRLGFMEILKDLTEHRTRIFGSDGILLLVMLAYCSALRIRFNGEEIRGWLTVCLLGSSGVGKSKVFESISEMLGVGDIFSCNTGRRTGLTYATVRSANSWRCQAGLLPRNSKKILCVEEAQDMPMSDLKTMADGMDKGVLQPENVARATFDCRTRVVFNANPKHERTLTSFPFGCLAIKEMFAMMFIRRLDVCAFIDRLEGTESYNRRVDTKHDPLVSPDELRALIFYAWSLGPDRIKIADDVTKTILEGSDSLSARFGHCPDIPLVCPSDFRKTLVRIAVAWAVLDLSTDETFENVTVKSSHVEYAISLINNLYSSPVCALDQYSDLCRRRDSLEDYPILKRELERRVSPQDALTGDSKFAAMVYLLTRGMSYRKQELTQLLDCDDQVLTQILTYLQTVHLVHTSSDKIGATPKFHRFMKRLSSDVPELYAVVATYKEKVKVESQDDS